MRTKDAFQGATFAELELKVRPQARFMVIVEVAVPEKLQGGERGELDCVLSCTQQGYGKTPQFGARPKSTFVRQHS